MLPSDNFLKQMVEKVHNCHFLKLVITFLMAQECLKLLFEIGSFNKFSFFEKQGLSYVLAIRRKP